MPMPTYVRERTMRSKMNFVNARTEMEGSESKHIGHRYLWAVMFGWCTLQQSTTKTEE
jgi:hypothetical protein